MRGEEEKDIDGEEGKGISKLNNGNTPQANNLKEFSSWDCMGTRNQLLKQFL